MSSYLPTELIELIATYLSNHQQYKCLFICKNWYDPIRRTLYKNIYIKTRHQFKILLPHLESKGLLVRSLYFRKSKHRVGITRKELVQLAVVCPYLEILDFDQEIWKYIHTSDIDKFLYVHRLPPFTHIKCIPNQSHRLTTLTLHGTVVSDLFAQGNIMTILKNTPRLKYLSLNSQQHKSHAIYISINELESIHESLPLLQELELIGSFKLIYYPPYITQQLISFKKCTYMYRFSLKASIDPQWFYYFAYKYPQLQILDLDLMNITKSITKKEIDNVFSILLNNCSQLRKIELDSLSAKLYLTSHFFDMADNHLYLQEIKLKQDLPYNLISRQDDSFNLLVTRGQKLISSLGTEVIESDTQIIDILQPLTTLQKLTNLILHCGHTYFDCELDKILDYCPNLLHLTIRSAHLTLSTEKKKYEAHGLISLSLSTVSFSSTIFDYLAIRCELLTRLVCYECDQKEGNVIQLHMPQHTFETLILNGIRLGSLDQPNVRMVLITQAKKSRWYHSYHSNTCSPKIHRLNYRQTKLVQLYFQEYKNLLKQQWQKDLSLGYISIQCQSIKHWEFSSETTFNEF